MTPTVPIRHDIVLVGGGHSHVNVLKRFGMKPEPGVRLTLVARDMLTPYSGMIPGYIAGHYTRAEAHIDLRPLAAFASARLIHAPATGIDLDNNLLALTGRPPIPFDLLSIDTGSTPSTLDIDGAEHALPVKPIDRFLVSYHALTDWIRHHTGPFHLTVVGGGAGGVELVLALAFRLRNAAHELGRDPGDFSFTLVEAGDTLLPGYNAAARNRMTHALKKRGILLQLGYRVTGITETDIALANGATLASDQTILVTSAGPPRWLGETALARNADGFVRVDDRLRSVSHPQVFAAGDAASMDGHDLPKAGVYAVRQGPYLAENLRRAVTGKTLRVYKPQGQTLALITTGEHHAIAARGPFALEGNWVWRWKDWIDRRWMKKYQELPDMDAGRDANGDVIEDMRCGGCGAKVPAPVLRRALSRLPQQSIAGLDQGLDAPDDAAVLTPPPGKSLIQTVDQFRAFIDDPFLFGRIAANHCLGDIFAMGAEPHSALAAVMLPHGDDDKMGDDLYQLLAGATETLAEAGAVLAGGHTGEGAEMAFGLTINGYAAPETIIRKGGLNPGDVLILTKPIGTGVLFAADMRAEARGDWIDAALTSMQASLKPCVKVMRYHGATAGTDVTGFGLAGHLLEMLEASSASAEIDLDAIPVLAGAFELSGQGVESTLRPGNEGSAGHAFPASVHPVRQLLFDPQTSGGLLFGVPGELAEACLAALHDGPATAAAIIGQVHKQGASGVQISYRKSS
jgi:selenide, water dikinase